MVTAGLEHEKFTNLFPDWTVSPSVQELNCKVEILIDPSVSRTDLSQG